MKHEVKIAGLLLAAGASTRMGEPKQLLIFKGKTILEGVLKETLNSNLDVVSLVLGHHAEKVKDTLGGLRNHQKLRIVINSNYQDGMASSIMAGLSSIEKDCDHVMILLADMPHIDSSLINKLRQEYLLSNLPMGAIKVGNRKSHPVIFSREIYPDLKMLKGDVGARGIFKARMDKVCFVSPGRQYSEKDIDTMEDYRLLCNGLND